jgi:undecaprenyl-diphosphatase
MLRELSKIDRAVYEAVAGQKTPALDRTMRKLSQGANFSTIWLGVAGLLALEGRRGRRAAITGLASIAVTSASVNIGLKSLHRRPRPNRQESPASGNRHVPMPESSSFPSGHSASAFAFASAAGVELPVLAFPLRALAAAVAYSRVHTGVHYPGDVVAGALLGAGIGQIVARSLDRRLA